MSFEERRTVANQDSKIRSDVEFAARMQLSDIEFLSKKICRETDGRLKRVMYESIVTKLATTFQLALRAFEYMEKSKERGEIIDRTNSDNSALGKIKKFRSDLFHDGMSFIQKDMYFPFLKIKGRGFVALRVRKGGALKIENLIEISAVETEFAITSEGVFEIRNTGQESEEWVQIDVMPTLTAANYDDIEKIVSGALAELRAIWHQLSMIRKRGDGEHEFSYLNEGGELELLEKAGGIITTYSTKKAIEIKGHLTVTPPDKIRVDGNFLIYE